MFIRQWRRSLGTFIALFVATALCSAQAVVQSSAVTQDKVGQVVELSGTVTSFQPSRSDRAPNSFKLKDDAGTIRVAIWPDVFSQISSRDALKEGAKVHVKGKVAEFRGAIEIHVNNASDITIEGAPAAPSPSAGEKPPAPPASPQASATKPPTESAGVVSIAELTSDKQGSKFTIQGTVTSARRPSSDRAPYVLKVKDATGSIDVVFWQDLADKLSDAQKANEGDIIRVTGTLGEYRGSLQLKPSSPADIQTQKSNPELKSSTPSATQQNPQAGAVRTAPAADFHAAEDGTIVEIRGKVASVVRMRTGQKITVTDGKNSWEVIVWATASGLKPAIEQVRGGEDVILRATVKTFEGSKVLIVTRPEDVLYVG